MGLELTSRAGGLAREVQNPICLHLCNTAITNSQNMSAGPGTQALMLPRQALSLQNHLPAVKTNFILEVVPCTVPF